MARSPLHEVQRMPDACCAIDCIGFWRRTPGIVACISRSPPDNLRLTLYSRRIDLCFRACVIVCPRWRRRDACPLENRRCSPTCAAGTGILQM